MKKQPLISIIIPVYKVEEYLEKCVNSVINQTYKNLEIILIDDGSPDNCPAICDKLSKTDKRIKVIHKTNSGVSASRNEGLKIATGEFVAFVDSDDWIDETMYERLINKQQEQNYDLVFCKYNIVDSGKVIKFNETHLEKLCSNNDISYFFNRSSQTDCNESTITIQNNVMCNIWRTLFKKDLITKYKFNTNIKYMEDLEFMCRIFLEQPNTIGFVDEYLYFYLKREGSAGLDKSSGMIENCTALIESLSKTLNSNKTSHMLSALKFFCFSECVLSKYVFGANISLQSIKEWSSNHNYKSLKKMSFGFKTKLKYFLIKHKLYFLIKIIYKLK